MVLSRMRIWLMLFLLTGYAAFVNPLIKIRDERDHERVEFKHVSDLAELCVEQASHEGFMHKTQL